MQQRSGLANPVFKALKLVEQGAAWLQGKGYGSATIAREVAAVASCMPAAPKLAIDVGGNVGKYSETLRTRFPDLEIHVFEPASVNVTKLRQLFKGDGRVVINDRALSNADSSATLYSDEPGGGIGSLANRRLAHFGIKMDCVEQIQTMRFEDYWRQTLQERAIDLAKLDIEGFELSALQGFGPALQATQVIQFEFGGCNLDTKTTFQDFFYFFTEAGFDLLRIAPLGLNKVVRYREIEEFYSTTNFVAVNRRARQL
jgi:FkbM family methyltransferase